MALAAGLALLVASCGFGTGGVIAAASGGGGGATNAAATPAGLVVLDPKTSPARIRIVVTDAEGDAATVDFRYVLPSEPGVERAVTGIAANPARLAGSPDGRAYEIPWNFAAEAGLGAQFTAGVTLIARLDGKLTQTTVVGLGNDAPEVAAVTVPSTEVVGIADVTFRVSDTSGDAVDIEAEFFDERNPTAGWRPARAAGTPAGSTGAAFRGVVAPPGGTSLTFFWDTDSRDGAGQPIGDLVDGDTDVRVRFRAKDAIVAGAPVESSGFRVDNNDAPIAQLEEGALLATGDRLLGVKVPFRVIDAESDAVRVLMQWRLASQNDFPALGTDDPTALAALLADPRFVREKQICVPLTPNEIGYAQPVNATKIRLPELALGSNASALGNGIVGRRIEFLRPANGTPVSFTAGWPINPLQAPVAALPVGDGSTALVLDNAGGSAVLREVVLTTGVVARTLATMTGVPTALCTSRQANTVLVATDTGGLWRLFECDLATGAATLRASQPIGGTAGPMRGVAGLGDTAALATLGSTLVRVDWATTVKVTTLLGGLATPTAVLLDPFSSSGVYVAELMGTTSGPAGRITFFDMQARLRRVAFTVPQPLAMAFDRRAGELRVLSRPLATPDSTVVTIPLTSAPSSSVSVSRLANTVAIGPDGMLLVTVSSPATLFVQGGVEQRRRITAYDPATTTATIEGLLVPLPRANQAWRFAAFDPFLDPTTGSPNGTSSNFVWDTSTVPTGENVLVRAVPIDTEAGVTDTASGSLSLQSPLARSVQTLNATGALAVATADLDGDGDLDTVVGDGSSIRVFSQGAPGAFAVSATLASGANGVAVADIDVDGRLDIAAATNSGLRLFTQNATGTFAAAVTVDPVQMERVVVADLDADGLPDLIAMGSQFVLVFHQDVGGTFSPPIVSNPEGAGVMTDVVTGDFDGDGALDYAWSQRRFDNDAGSANAIAARRQTSPRNYAQPTIQGVGRPPTTLFAADVDGDGDLDFVTNRNSPDLGSLVVLTQTAGQFTTGFELGLPGVTDNTVDLIAHDVDGDGDLDLVGTNTANNVLVVHQLAPGQFSTQPLLLGGSPTTLGPQNLLATDLDGDGRTDLIVRTAGGNGVTILSHDLGQRLATSPVIALGGPAVLTNLVFPIVADLTGDRVLDVASHRSDANFPAALRIFRQEPNTSFTTLPQIDIAGFTSVQGMAAGNFDGDGDTDLVSSNGTGAGDAKFSRQTAPGVFTTSSITNATFLRKVHAGDLDNDGDLDVAFLDDTGSIHLAFQGPGAATGTLAATTTLGGSGAVVIADLDGDGDNDIASRAATTNQLAVRLQTSPGVFAATPAVVPMTGTLAALAAADLDGDGDLDLVLGAAGALSIALQTTPGVFAPQPLSATSCGSIAIADLDADGRPDIVADLNGVLNVFRQVGRGTFRALGTTIANNIGALSTADVDGDGFVDVVGGDSGATQIRVFRAGR